MCDNRQKNYLARKAIIQEEKRDPNHSIRKLALQIEQQNAQLRHLSRIVAELEYQTIIEAQYFIERSQEG